MLLLLAVLLPVLAAAQTKVPGSIQASFEKTAGVDKAEWAQGPQATYEASFTKSGNDYVYVYSKTGKLLQKKQYAESILLPTSIGNTIAYDYPRGKIDRAYRVLSADKKKYYEVHVVDGPGVDRVQFDMAGSFLAVVQSEAAQAAPAAIPAPSPQPERILASNATPAPAIAMRGEADMVEDNAEDDLEIVDEDIADLFEEEEEDLALEPLEEESWDEILEEEEEDDWEEIESWGEDGISSEADLDMVDPE